MNVYEIYIGSLNVKFYLLKYFAIAIRQRRLFFTDFRDKVGEIDNYQRVNHMFTTSSLAFVDTHRSNLIK